MTDLPLSTTPPFEFIPPEQHDRERELREEANERARYLARKHGLRKPVAWTAAIAEQGAAAPRWIGSTTGTVGEYLDELEERFGVEATTWTPPEERTGPLGDGDGDGDGGRDGNREHDHADAEASEVKA
jgi:hypothetical protein